MAPKLPLRARQFLEGTKMAPETEIALSTGATEYDVNFPQGVYANINVDVAPWATTIGWLTSVGVEYLPGKSNFREGFRVVFGAPAPAGAKLCYAVRVTP
jgi:hypothetical protein